MRIESRMPSEPDTLSIIPLPATIERRTGELAITPETAIVHDADNDRNARYLRDLLAPPTGFALPVRADEPGLANVIRLRIGGDRKVLGREGYALTVSAEAITVEAPESTGVFRGIQTLRQMLPVEIERRGVVPDIVWRVPCVMIEDAPRFKWRGYMMDEGRHFHGTDTMLRTLDLMAMQKLNVLHWHLTEDQGWRIEIKRYPKLTEIGSKRKGTARGWFGGHDGIPHGGFYTQDEIKEIIAYAAERHITIVPEIEMPGHSLAALAAYPELSCTGGPFEVSCRFGPTWDIYCAGKEQVFTFLQNVLDEVVALFPSSFIHIGGDEAPKARWKKCPNCREQIKQEGLRDAHELQVYFTNRIAAYLDSHGRRAMGWNEILQKGLVKSAVVQYWVGKRKPVIEAIKHGRDVVMSSFWRAYLDHSYSFTSLSKAYKYEPVFPELDEQDEQHVLGLEAPMWTEMVPNRARLDYQTYPRLTALAETGWSPREKRDFKDFQRRLGAFLPRLDELGVRYARGKDVEPPWYKQLFGPLTIAQTQTKIAPE
jgi:hexosaminidase